jgi:hypothetical protein
VEQVRALEHDRAPQKPRPRHGSVLRHARAVGAAPQKAVLDNGYAAKGYLP